MSCKHNSWSKFCSKCQINTFNCCMMKLNTNHIFKDLYKSIYGLLPVIKVAIGIDNNVYYFNKNNHRWLQLIDIGKKQLQKLKEQLDLKQIIVDINNVGAVHFTAHFEKITDSSLFCCSNGVIEWSRKDGTEFRNGLEKDYVTTCCNIPYIILSENDKRCHMVHNYMRKLFPIDNTRYDVYRFIRSTILHYRLAYVMTITGENIKVKGIAKTNLAQFLQIVKFIFGEYYETFPRECIYANEKEIDKKRFCFVDRCHGYKINMNTRLSIIENVEQDKTISIDDINCLSVASSILIHCKKLHVNLMNNIILIENNNFRLMSNNELKEIAISLLCMIFS